jgi:hypothetical protein
MRALTRFLPALLLGALLTGCGSDDAAGSGAVDSDGSASSESSQGSSDPGASADDDAFDPTTATLSDEGFCDQLDPDALGLAVQSKKLDRRIDYARGKTYTDYTGKKFVAPSSWCLYSDNPVSDRGNTVSIQLTKGTDADIAKAMESYRSSGDTPGYDKSCEVTEETTFGEPGGVAVCIPNKGSSATTSISTFGLVSGVKFACSGSMAETTDAAALESRVRAMCGDVLETLAD